MMFSLVAYNSHRIFKRLAKALISLRVCAGWSEPLLVAHTILLEISCHGSINKGTCSHALIGTHCFCFKTTIQWTVIEFNKTMDFFGQKNVGPDQITSSCLDLYCFQIHK